MRALCCTGACSHRARYEHVVEEYYGLKLHVLNTLSATARLYMMMLAVNMLRYEVLC